MECDETDFDDGRIADEHTGADGDGTAALRAVVRDAVDLLAGAIEGVYPSGDVETATDRLATVVDDAPEDTTATARVQRALEHLDNRPTDSRVDEGRSRTGCVAAGHSAHRATLNKSATSSEPSKRSKLSEPSDPDETAEGGGVKSEQVGTYMYLPKDQKKDLERLYNVLKAEYEHAYDADFEKNRHYYPLVVQYGIESLDGLDASEIREHLDAMSLAS